MKEHLTDCTNWQRMAKNEVIDAGLVATMAALVNKLEPELRQFDISPASQQTVPILHDARLETTFVERAGSLVSDVEVANGIPSEVLHGFGNTGPAGGGHHQVYEVGHEDPCVDGHAKLCGGFLKPDRVPLRSESEAKRTCRLLSL